MCFSSSQLKQQQQLQQQLLLHRYQTEQQQLAEQHEKQLQQQIKVMHRFAALLFLICVILLNVHRHITDNKDEIKKSSSKIFKISPLCPPQLQQTLLFQQFQQEQQRLLDQQQSELHSHLKVGRGQGMR